MSGVDIACFIGVAGCVAFMFMANDISQYLAKVFFPCEEDYYNPRIEHHVYGYKPSEEYLETVYLIDDFDFMTME